MPRRGNVPKREILPDPLYNSVLVTKLTNSIMLDGKKGVAQKVVYGAFEIIQEKTGKDPMEVFTAAMENIMPSLETKSRRVGGSTYQVPMEVRPERRQTLGLRWLTTYSRNRSEKTMKERLAGEVMDAANNVGNAVKKREDVHKMAEANILEAASHNSRLPHLQIRSGKGSVPFSSWQKLGFRSQKNQGRDKTHLNRQNCF